MNKRPDKEFRYVFRFFQVCADVRHVSRPSGIVPTADSVHAIAVAQEIIM